MCITIELHHTQGNSKYRAAHINQHETYTTQHMSLLEKYATFHYLCRNYYISTNDVAISCLHMYSCTCAVHSIEILVQCTA